MRHAVGKHFAEWLAGSIALSCAFVLLSSGPARSATTKGPDQGSASSPPEAGRGEIDDTTWVDHDRQPIQRPPDWQPSYWGRRFHQGFVEPISHLFDIPDKLLWATRAFGARTQREAVNVNAFDEVPNSAWFTNRNQRRAVPVADLREGPDSAYAPAKPWTIRHAKMAGVSVGFEIKDANGAKWLVKLDSRGSLQLSSGADMVARTLLSAAGYNVPHNESVRFGRGDLTISPDLIRGAKGERFTESDLDSALVRGATFPDGSYSATASLFIEGHVLGSPSMDRARPGDSNDWYAHVNRRELRGLFVVCSWINNWDTEDHQFLDSFVDTRDSLGHVQHYILDAGSSFGASASGPKQLWMSYENMLDIGWTARRFATLGFSEEPSRRAHQASGFASVGNYESAVYEPNAFKQLVPMPAFREMTDRDGYWGAKIVASFSDAQIAAAVDAARYENPRAADYLVQNLIVRRDKIARHWFGRVAPLDFFEVVEGALRFRDLAVDIGLAGARGYDVTIESSDGARPPAEEIQLSRAELPLDAFGAGASHASIAIGVAGNMARPTHVSLTRKGSEWIVTRVRHG